MFCLMKDEKVIAENVKKADTFFSRGIGLMFAPELKGFNALWITPTNSIHTCFMKFSLDVVFLNKKNKVVKIIRNLKPWRMTRPYFSAFSVLEFKAGSLDQDLKEGDQLDFKCIN